MVQNFNGGSIDESGLENFDEYKIDECQCHVDNCGYCTHAALLAIHVSIGM